MKKITTRLIQQFVGLLLIFATMIALFFGVLFAKQTEDLHQEEMTHRSQLISETLTDYFSTGTEMGQGGGMGGYGAFLRFLNQIAGEEVWVLVTEMNPIISSHHDSPSKQTDPPNEAKSLSPLPSMRKNSGGKKTKSVSVTRINDCNTCYGQ